MTEGLDNLATRYGVLPTWRGLDRAAHVVTPETKRALLRAMRIDPDAPPPPPLGPDAVTLAADTPGRAAVAAGADWTLIDESGAERAGGRSAGQVDLPALPAGYALLNIARDGREETRLVVSAPSRAPSVMDVAGRRVWGVTAPLYGLWSRRSAGIGDYRDLGAAAEALAGLGADFIGVNPIHAPGAGPRGISPYSPSHRGFFNPDHIALEGDPLAPRPMLDYAAARACRHALQPPGADRDFDAWRAAQAAPLDAFVRFEAAQDGETTRRRAWLQYQADRQIGDAQRRAKAAGMALGLYLDIAVAARPDGAEVALSPEAYAAGATLGAPPDALAPGGQDWALAPFSPPGLAAARFAPFIAMLRATMRHAGLIRIDHAIGLMRGFWVPHDGAPGGYVRMPLEPLLAIVRLEATRARCVVIGEDLGVAPDGLREALGAAGLHGMSVMQYDPAHPRDWRAMTLGCFGTHDTPTLKGWRAGRDIDWRERLAEPLDHEAARAERRWCVGCMDGTLAGGADAVHPALAAAPCELAAVQLADALGEIEQENLPGLTAPHPNWRRRCAIPVEDFATDARLRAMAATMNAGRPR